MYGSVGRDPTELACKGSYFFGEYKIFFWSPGQKATARCVEEGL